MAAPRETDPTGTAQTSQTIAETLQAHAHWAIRLAFAGVFLFHGLEKLADPAAFAGMMGLPVAVAIVVGLAETGAGALVLVGGFGQGWATRLAGLLVIPVVLGAIAMVHWPRWTFVPAPEAGFPMGGMEFQVTLTAIAAFLVVKGEDC